MKSQLLILGNGFDLQCGLRSSYQEFFTQEILDATNEGFGIVRIRRDVTGFWEGLLFEYYKKYKNTDYPWYVVENIIKDTLWRICYGGEDSSANIEKGWWKRALTAAKSAFKSGFHVSRTPDSIESYILEFCSTFFYHNSMPSQGSSDLVELQALIKRLLVELKNFERRFCQYIKSNLVNPNNKHEINETYVGNAFDLLACLIGVPKENRKHLNLYDNLDEFKSTHILSFNYTALFDILAIESPCKYVNVHGKLCNRECTDKCVLSSIIFGIDDKLIQAQDKYKDLRVFSKTYRKMSAAGVPEKVLPTNDAPVDIKFYGHSLSEADYSYFQGIFDYYNLYSNNGLSLYFYYSTGFDPTDAVYRLINEYGKTLTNKDQGKNLMHKLLLENRIKIVNIKN